MGDLPHLPPQNCTFSNAIKENIEKIESTHTGLEDAVITINTKKCKFFTMEFEYLGLISKPRRLDIEHVNTTSLREALSPEIKLELRSVLGLCNIYRRFSTT